MSLLIYPRKLNRVAGLGMTGTDKEKGTDTDKGGLTRTETDKHGVEMDRAGGKTILLN